MTKLTAILTAIEEAAYADKGIRVKPNPLGLSVSEAQRAFDELTLDVVIPYFNALAETQNRNNTVLEDEKVDKVEGKALSANDFTDEYRDKVESIDQMLDLKVDKVEGKSLSANDYTTEEKNAVATLMAQLALGRMLSSNDFTDKYIKLINSKVSKVSGKGLSTNDYTDADKAQVNKIALKADTADVLLKDNTARYTPLNDYEPATKKYVDDNVIAGGVPQTREINGHALTEDIVLTAEDVGAVALADKNKIADDTTGINYVLGIDNGGLYYMAVSQ